MRARFVDILFYIIAFCSLGWFGFFFALSLAEHGAVYVLFLEPNPIVGAVEAAYLLFSSAYALMKIIKIMKALTSIRGRT